MNDVLDKYNNLDLVDQMGVSFMKEIIFSGEIELEAYHN
jgi:hypothetical protein